MTTLRANPPGKIPPAPERQRPLSMHEGIAAWCDCCSCEAEPRWLEVAEELGIDLGSDYETAPPQRRTSVARS